MRSRPWIGGVALCLSVAAFPACRPETGEGPLAPAPVEAYVDVDVGLSREETDAWRWTSEGSNLVPVGALWALTDVTTGRPFIESLPRFGFLPSPAGAANPYGLPVGWVTDVPELSPLGLSYVGVNCSACHTGQIERDGQRLRIDGAPNLADVEALALTARDSVLAMLKDPKATFRFFRRLLEAPPTARAVAEADAAEADAAEADAAAESLSRLLEPDARAELSQEQKEALVRGLGEAYVRILRGEAEDPRQELERALSETIGEGVDDDTRRELGRSNELVAKYGALLRDRVELGLRAIRAIEMSPDAGPGRDDPWGLIRNVLFRRKTPLTAATSIPHLFHSDEFVWYHADGNTTSVMQRDVAQAVALGAYVDAATGESTLLPRNIWRLEGLLAKIRSPAWPEAVLGEIDREKAERGRAIFERPLAGPGTPSCQNCHASRNGTVFAQEEIGTDPNRASSFLEPIDGRPFHEQVPEQVSRIQAVVFARAGITPEEESAHQPPAPPRWRATGGYLARRLDGVWATAPYLHNGSVPTLYHLLLPASERPRSFPLGHREYDPDRVGYLTEAAAAPFVFDTAVDGNSNAGHEVANGLSETERWELIEYLKTL